MCNKNVFEQVVLFVTNVSYRVSRFSGQDEIKYIRYKADLIFKGYHYRYK